MFFHEFTQPVKIQKNNNYTFPPHSSYLLSIYMHCLQENKKIIIIKRALLVCFLGLVALWTASHKNAYRSWHHIFISRIMYTVY
jgi:hypothetical protein